MDYPIIDYFITNKESRWVPFADSTNIDGVRHAIVEDFFVQGGFHVCSGLTGTTYSRNNITYDRRKIGMMVYDIVGKKYWRLISEPEPEPSLPEDRDPNCATLTTDTDWEEVLFASSGLTFSAITYDINTETLTIEFRDVDNNIVSGSTIIPMSPSGMTFSAITYDSVPSTVQVEFKIGSQSITGETVLNYINTGATTADLTWTNPFGLKIGGIPRGTTFPDTGLTMWQMWTDLLYPPQVGLWYVSPLSGSYPCEGTISNSITYYVTFSNWTGSLNWNVVAGDGGFYHIVPPASGTSDGSFSVWCDPNPTGVIRTGHVNVFVSGETTPVQVTITQIPCEMNYDIQPTHQYSACTAGSKDYDITFTGTWLTAKDWTLVQDNDSTSWCTLSQYTGTGPTTVTATFTQNDTGLERIATFTLTALGQTSSRVAYFHHTPCTEKPDFIVIPSSYTVPYPAGSVEYTGKTSGTWSALTKSFQISSPSTSIVTSISPTLIYNLAVDEFTFVVNYSANVDINPRTAEIVVNAYMLTPEKKRSVYIYQGTPPPVLGFNVTPPQHTYNCNGTNIDGDTFTVNLTGDWDTDGRPKNWWITNPYQETWCTLNRTGGTAPTLTFTATCDALAVGQNQRDVTYTVAASGITDVKTVKVEQNRCPEQVPQYWFFWGKSINSNITSGSDILLMNSALTSNIVGGPYNFISGSSYQFLYWAHYDGIGTIDSFSKYGSNWDILTGQCDLTDIRFINLKNQEMFYHTLYITIGSDTLLYKVYRSNANYKGPVSSNVDRLR